jgi:integrase/recombinase XerD
LQDILAANAVADTKFTSSGVPRGLSLAEMADFDALCLRSAGRKPATEALSRLAIGKLIAFMVANNLPTEVDVVNAYILRNFTIYLSTIPKFLDHPFTHTQKTLLSQAATNGYLRALRAAFGRWVSEGIIPASPFATVHIPAPHYKRREALSAEEIRAFVGAIDTTTPEGFSDGVLILTFFDCGARLCGMRTLLMTGVDLKLGRLTVTEKGDKTRYVFIGSTVQKLLFKYIKLFRPEPVYPNADFLFLNRYGRPLTKQRVEAKFRRYALKAGLDPHKCTPHVARHSFCTHFVRNGGGLSDLQAISGHSDIKSLSIYLHPAPEDLKAVHLRCSPVDHLQLNLTTPKREKQHRPARGSHEKRPEK